MKEKYFSYKYLLSFLILLTCLFIFSIPSLALIPGDFGSADNGPPDGVVDFEDLMIFALAYGSVSTDTNWNPDCDIAGLGSTTPDGIIDFEDLMVFAMHYGECAPPSAPTLSDPGTNLPSPANYTVSWPAVTTATSYVLQEATSSDFSGAQEYTLSSTSKDFSHTVTTTTTYYYRVAAINDCGQGDWSNMEDIQICPCTPPSPPTLSDPGTTVQSPANYPVSWSSVSGATSYLLQEATSSDFTSGLQEYPVTGTNKSFSHTVTTTTTYYYRVAAINDCGQGDWSNMEDIQICPCTPPSPPTLSDPGTTVQSPANYPVSWSVVNGATSYKIQEATSSNFTSGLLEYPLTDTSKDFSHTVTTTTTYYYRVAAVNSYGQGGWSNVEDIDIVTCSSPPVTEVTALGFTYHSSYMSVVQSIINKLIKENRIHESYPLIPKKIERMDVVYEIYIEWAEYTEDKPNGYKVYKSIDGGSYQLIVEGDTDAGYGYYSLTDTTVTVGSTYSYYITAYGSGWETCSSEPAITTVLPWCSLASPLDGVTIKNNPNPDFSWSPVGVSTFPYGAISYGYSDLLVYDITADSESWHILFNNMAISTATYDQDGQATPLISNHSYTWNSCGYGYDEKGDNLIAVSCSEDWGFDYCTAPSPPILSDPGGTLPAPATYTVSWTPVSEVTSYVLQEATSSSFSGATSHPVTGTSKSFSHTAITTYYYRVAAINDCGQGSWSNIVDIEICPCTPPTPPTLSDPGDTLPSPADYTVNWSSVSGAKSYVLQEATSFDFTSGLQEYTLFGTSKSFSYTVSTTTTYYYQVAAINDCGQSGWSNIQDVTVAIDPVHNLTKETYYNTIQAALDDADNDNIIEVPDGTYDESITFPSAKKITLQSVNGPSSTTIRGNDGSPTVISCDSTEDTTLEGFTITHNSGENGRGIDISEGFLIIDNCTISANTAPTYGGGIYNQGGILTITASTTISANTAPTLGGGIYNNGGTLTITGSTISGNTTDDCGGGIYNNGTLNITSSSTISSNTADDCGGGIFNWDGISTITSSTISGNYAGKSGGGIHNHSGISTITSSTISSNTADDCGGGIFNWDYGTLTITSSTISGNTATGNGGGIYNFDGISTITSSTIFGNNASYGAGIYNYNTGTLTITGSNISGNTADYGGGIYNGTGSTLDITSSIISGNDVTGYGGGIFINISTITIGGSNWLDFGNFNTFTDNKKDGTILADQHICNSSGDCRSSYPYNFYNPN